MRNTGCVFIFFVLLVSGCARKKTELAWEMNFPATGSQSSPRSADLNGDGVLDLVMGAGKNEYQHSKQRVPALDGATGTLLWAQEANDQVYRSASLFDISGDGAPEIFI